MDAIQIILVVVVIAVFLISFLISFLTVAHASGDFPFNSNKGEVVSSKNDRINALEAEIKSLKQRQTQYEEDRYFANSQLNIGIQLILKRKEDKNDILRDPFSYYRKEKK